MQTKRIEELEARGDTCMVEDAAGALGISRGLAFKLARSGELPGVLRLGRRYVVSVAALRRALEGGNGG